MNLLTVPLHWSLNKISGFDKVWKFDYYFITHCKKTLTHMLLIIKQNLELESFKVWEKSKAKNFSFCWFLSDFLNWSHTGEFYNDFVETIPILGDWFFWRNF